MAFAGGDESFPSGKPPSFDGAMSKWFTQSEMCSRRRNEPAACVLSPLGPASVLRGFVSRCSIYRKHLWRDR